MGRRRPGARLVQGGVVGGHAGQDVRDHPKIAARRPAAAPHIFAIRARILTAVYGVASLPLGAPVELRGIPRSGRVRIRKRRGRRKQPLKRRRAAVRVGNGSPCSRRFRFPPERRGRNEPWTRRRSIGLITIDGLSIFYREAGPTNAPTILLLHGLPSSSRMFEPLFARLSDRYHLVAPDYPGLRAQRLAGPEGLRLHVRSPRRRHDRFTETLGLSRYTLYMQDYGGPVGLPHGAGAPRARRGADRPGRRRPRRRARRRTGRRGGRSGPTARPTRPRCARTFSRSRRRERATSGAIRTSSATIRTSGRTNSASSTRPARPTSRATSSTTTARTSPPTRSGRRGCATRSRGSSSSGASTTSRSTPRSRRPTAATCPSAEVHMVDGGHFALDTAADEIAGLVAGFLK